MESEGWGPQYEIAGSASKAASGSGGGFDSERPFTLGAHSHLFTPPLNVQVYRVYGCTCIHEKVKYSTTNSSIK